MNKYQVLLEAKADSAAVIEVECSNLMLCPDLGGRVFAEVCGRSMHRIDLDAVANPIQPFNYGGNNFWPAPEGGQFGFNYVGDEWYVQEGLGNQPFDVVSKDGSSVAVEKRLPLSNRAGVSIMMSMKREVEISAVPHILGRYNLDGSVTYATKDSFRVLNEVAAEDALIAAWTLEQFDASEHTISFCRVPNPEEAINFDYYEHPEERIKYFPDGFTYHTDGLCRGQIGVHDAAAPSFIGFYDLEERILCLRTNAGPKGGIYFNIADNEQPNGPFSSADSYSIFNSDNTMRAFELETIGTAIVQGGLLKGSQLTSYTTLAVFQHRIDLESFINQHICRRFE